MLPWWGRGCPGSRTGVHVGNQSAEERRERGCSAGNGDQEPAATPARHHGCDTRDRGGGMPSPSIGAGRAEEGMVTRPVSAQQSGNGKATSQVRSQSRRARRRVGNSGEWDGVALQQPWGRDRWPRAELSWGPGPRAGAGDGQPGLRVPSGPRRNARFRTSAEHGLQKQMQIFRSVRK